MSIIKLEEGMVVYCFGGMYNKIARYVITRTTPKQAIIEFDNYDVRFNREVDSEFFFAKGSSNYSRDVYRLETEEIKQQYIRQTLENKVKSINVAELNVEQLKQIVKIMEINNA